MTNSQWFGIILVGLGIVGLIFIFSNLKMIEKAEEVEEDEVGNGATRGLKYDSE